MAGTIGTGATITFGTSGFTAEFMSVDGSGNDGIEDINISHLGTTGYHKYIPTSIKEGGEFSLPILYDGTDNPVVGVAEVITIAWSNAGTSWAFSGYMKEFTPTAPLEDKMTANIVVKVAGDITKDVTPT
jgi:hypothetical protein